MPADNRRSPLLVVALVALCSGCASSALKLGENAELRQDYDRAVVEYTNALRQASQRRQCTPGARTREAARRR